MNRKYLLPAIFTVLFLLSVILNFRTVFASVAFYSALGLFICAYLPLHKVKMNDVQRKEKTAILLWAAALILFTTVLTTLSPAWKEDGPRHIHQYEEITESFLKGKITQDYYVDERLLAMENPYDYEAREREGVIYYWDSAFYKGNYYMYFGVVPVFLLFLPYRLISGSALPSYVATAVFIAFAIAGLFTMFYYMSRRFFTKVTVLQYLLLSTVFTLISTYYAAMHPSLYCTAISASLALEIWSLYFYLKVVFDDYTEAKRIRYALLGAIFGALAFGCRPPVALGNLAVLVLFAVYLKRQGIRQWKPMMICLLPYVLVAVGLMIYNYVRFENPLEFGQAYQLTIADQHLYGSILTTLKAQGIRHVIKQIIAQYFAIGKAESSFPFLNYGGAFINCPLFLSVFFLLHKKVREYLLKQQLFSFVVTLVIISALISFADVAFSPFLMERYRLDIYFLLSISAFCVILAAMEVAQGKKEAVFYVASLFTLLELALILLIPDDSNVTAYYYPEALETIVRILCFSFL